MAKLSPLFLLVALGLLALTDQARRDQSALRLERIHAENAIRSSIETMRGTPLAQVLRAPTVPHHPQLRDAEGFVVLYLDEGGAPEARGVQHSAQAHEMIVVNDLARLRPLRLDVGLDLDGDGARGEGHLGARPAQLPLLVPAEIRLEWTSRSGSRQEHRVYTFLAQEVAP